MSASASADVPTSCITSDHGERAMWLRAAAYAHLVDVARERLAIVEQLLEQLPLLLQPAAEDALRETIFLGGLLSRAVTWGLYR